MVWEKALSYLSMEMDKPMTAITMQAKILQLLNILFNEA
jgi:hypothetical protein